ncbi:MAG: phosphoribosylglycinamide formyltransferase [Bacteroidota bacterium]|nr:phosphoribosylglycinamide formyltransferase [Bacteroidota bacterium]
MNPRFDITKSSSSNKKIAIFASGAGSNAKRIIEHFTGHTNIFVSLIVTNNSNAGVVQIAVENNIAVLHVEKERFFRGDGYVDELKSYHVSFIVLAGFLWKIPDTIISNFKNRIINIHPALLPKFGGKGMYGLKVHEAVIKAGETESGITIHFVDEHYDNGNIIFQATCPVLKTDTADALAEKIHRLEHENFPTVVEECVNKFC